ncbi:hypothetical protein BDN70DRAFT_334295 [Pholiota conissans]|uniref:ubiquitinyl hydrolase 1 n=1 Tax=Pholiota conissans TaxID=109636 RepID=A0A9P5YQW3_9AGAR|nr:hypothetical protein BDN70DRAFT_334295 [Pholiota conissans]
MGGHKTSIEDLHYILNHVFLPPKLPQSNDNEMLNKTGDLALCKLAYKAAASFPEHLPIQQRAQWATVIKMLKSLVDMVDADGGFTAQGELVEKILSLEEKDALALHIRAQNAGLIIRRVGDQAIFEAFEVSPPPEDVMGIEGKLICSYPGPAVQIPLSVARNRSFAEQLINFLSHMDVDELDDAVAKTKKAGSTVHETRGTTHPKYITELLVAILHGIGEEANIERITKRIADEVCWSDARIPWRRSPIWLIVRVAVQTTSESRDIYKAWMLFFHSRLLQMFLERDFSSDLLHTSRVKTGRRAYKIRESAPPSLLEFVKDVVLAVQQCLEGRWIKEQRLQSESPSYVLDNSAIRKDTRLSLINSREYLTRVLQPDTHSDTPAPFCPSHQHRLRDQGLGAVFPDGLSKAIHADSDIALFDFEFLVRERLSDWVSEHINDPSACRFLGSWLDQYISAAMTQYVGNAEEQSIMLLTVLDLWVALDRIACHQQPLLLSYSPEIPASILDPILVRHFSSLGRASAIQLYLRRRYSGADSNSTPIFSPHITGTTFAVRYFRQSTTLQALKSKIEASASNERAEKNAELEKLNAEHAELIQKANALNCTFVSRTDRYGRVKTKHKLKRCSKCCLEGQAAKMQIDVYEWPLPSETHTAEAVVFEMRCPQAFSVWRTQTYRILRDIGMAHIPAKSSTTYALDDYDGLAKWLKKGVSGRIVFASTTKSFLRSHYHDISIPAGASSVCVNNGLSFRLFDQNLDELVHSSFDVSIDPYCTLRLPDNDDNPYRHLQYAVAGTTHAHNSTIAAQGECPITLGIHEQLAFSNLRCGSQLQWLNIARELRTQVLTFSAEEVHTLFMQAALQMGPLFGDGSFRVWHAELTISEFGFTLIQEAEGLLSHVEANWMEINTVKTIIYLVCRLLASATDTRVHEMSFRLLRKARTVTHRWTREILCKIQDIVDDDKQIRTLQIRACEAAVTCKATYDLDSEPHLRALLSSSADVAILIECAIVIHDNTPLHLTDFPNFEKFLRRDRRLNHFLESRIVEWIYVDRGALDTAIVAVWPQYNARDSCWSQLPQPNSRWVTSSTKSLFNQRLQQVHYNILTGKLVIDGRSLGRLPKEIVGHSIYERILGQNILDVIPATMAGMEYASRILVQGHELFFAFRKDAKIPVIRARDHTGRTFELIPHTIFAGDFPSFFSSDYVHWMDVNNGEVEFRPLDQLWQQSSVKWRLEFSLNGSSRMTCTVDGAVKLVDIRSKTFRRIAARVAPLESPEYLIITAGIESESHLLSVELPRLRLSFFINTDDDLESSNMHGMVIDDDQSTGTLIGLSSQLILRHKEDAFASLPRSRIVLIPFGEVHYSISSSANHVCVRIDTKSQQQVTWYRYEIDTDLGLLAGSVSITSRLFLIYLHALTSHPLPDPLTSQRGTDRALEELAAAGSFSFQQLTKLDIELLRLIGSITPKREYYPKHLRNMQTTSWSPLLPVLSQHGLFDAAVFKIMQYAQSLTVFPELSCEEAEYNCSGDPTLMARATRRNAIYYEGPIRPSAHLDKEYHSRDYSRYSNGAIEALNTSRLVYIWPKSLAGDRSTFSGLLATFQRWDTIEGIDPNTSLTYSKEWLDLFLPTQWLSVYELCRRMERPRSHKFQLLFSFAALAYRIESALLRHIRMFLAFASLDKSLLESAPDYASYNLDTGFEPRRERVTTAISSKLYDLDASPAGQLHRGSDEMPDAFEERVRQNYRDTSRNKVDEVVDLLFAQWPSPDPRTPFRTDTQAWFRSEYIDDVESYFASCFHNSQLREFVSRISHVLGENIAISPLTDLPTSSLRFSPQYSVSTTFLSLFPNNLRDLWLNRDVTVPSRTPSFGLKLTYDVDFTGNHEESPINTTGLTNLISQFQRNHHSALHQLYSQRLQLSIDELHGQQTPRIRTDFPPTDICYTYRQQCKSRLSDLFSRICFALSPFTPAEKILEHAGIWPSRSQRAIIQQLSASGIAHRSELAKTALITLAEAFIESQHSQRLVESLLRSDITNFSKELDNASFNDIDARNNPEWLLVQIQGNFIIRPIQSHVAREMISPSLGQNIALQLNMGEGKSHVIVPLVASALANSRNLVRVVVLKPLAKQMFGHLVERLSGLANRRIFYLPFSRDVKATPQVVKKIRNLFEECARVGGILVAQPEHILSFRLMVNERILSSDSRDFNEVAQDLQVTQRWLNQFSRDILDESDEVLHIRYQLIYTMDHQQPVDDGPDRWITTQRVFDLVCHHMRHIQEEYPNEVEIAEQYEATNRGSFPHFRLLDSSASQALVSRIADEALNGMLDSLTFVGLGSRPSLRSDILCFLTIKDIDPQTYEAVQDIYKATSFWKGLLLLRGLLAHGILAYVLRQRRYRVDYGLDPQRSSLAVPYRAKDVPSLRSEFGHPDVIICLTCLSYYYGGLTPAQVRESFELVVKLDNPSLEYESWVRRGGDSIPSAIRRLIGVNMKDVDTFTRIIIPVFQHNKGTIDFYLSRVVFPKEAKEFPSKLGTSGWDLAEMKANFTTGFSGTNDNSDLLPTSITQTDPVGQLRTNAQVLEYLLRPENDRYLCIQGRSGGSCSAADLLDVVFKEPNEIRVLLDVGAQVKKILTIVLTVANADTRCWK